MLTIRPATTDDALQIATVHVKTWQFAYRGQMPDTFLDTMAIEPRAERWRTILATQNAQSQTLVAESEGTVVGFCSVGKCRDRDVDQTVGELYAIYIDPTSMRRGVGAALIAAGQAYLREQGFTRATLWVLESNQRARQFYTKKGWVADGMTRIEEISNVPLSELRYAIQLNHNQ